MFFCAHTQSPALLWADPTCLAGLKIFVLLAPWSPADCISLDLRGGVEVLFQVLAPGFWLLVLPVRLHVFIGEVNTEPGAELLPGPRLNLLIGKECLKGRRGWCQIARWSKTDHFIGIHFGQDLWRVLVATVATCHDARSWAHGFGDAKRHEGALCGLHCLQTFSARLFR